MGDDNVDDDDDADEDAYSKQMIWDDDKLLLPASFVNVFELLFSSFLPLDASSRQ